MKTLRSDVGLIVFVAGLVLTSSTWAGREFTSTNGCVIKGTLLDYSTASQMVAIQREGKARPCPAPIAVFCDTDRQYIQAWAFERDFRSSLDLRPARGRRKTGGGHGSALRPAVH